MIEGGVGWWVVGVGLALYLLGPMRVFAQPVDPKPEDAAPQDEPQPVDPSKDPPPDPPKDPAPPKDPPPKVDPKPTAPVNASTDLGETIRSYTRLRAGPFVFQPILLVQAEGLPYVGPDALAASGDPADGAGFRLQRGRFGLDVGIGTKDESAEGWHTQARGRVSVELGSREDGSARLQDAWIGYVGFPYVQAIAGAQTIPFSRSSIAGAGNQALSDRPLAVRAMAPGQQVGVVVRGDVTTGTEAAPKDLVSYDVGLFNGLSRSDRFFEGYAQNFAPLGNRFEGIAVVARVATAPVGRLNAEIADLRHEAPRFSLGADYFYSDGGARGIHGASFDALVHARGFHLLAEGVVGYVAPKTQPTEPIQQVSAITSFGVVGEAGYEIVRNLFGLAARFEYVDADTAVDDEGNAWLITGGAHVEFLDGIVKVGAEYTHREETYGVDFENDALLFQGQLHL